MQILNELFLQVPRLPLVILAKKIQHLQKMIGLVCFLVLVYFWLEFLVKYFYFLQSRSKQGISVSKVKNFSRKGGMGIY